MSMSMRSFVLEIGLLKQQWANYAGLTSEMTAVANALGSDTLLHDHTIDPPIAALRIGASQTPFTNDLNLVVTKGKAGNLSPMSMANAISSVIAAPTIITPPVVSGTATVGSTLSCTQGTWQFFPMSYAYQWLRAGAAIAGANAATYLLVAADSAKSVACQVTATNNAGNGQSTSNAIAVA